LAVLTFINDGTERKISCENGSNLLDVARLHGIHIDAYCGGLKKCGKCTVNINGLGKRLACETIVENDLTVEIPRHKESVVLTETAQKTFDFDDTNGEDETLGVAVDIGTTTLAIYICKLSGENAGTIIARNSAVNPQTAFGADVLSRISYAQTPGGLEKMRGCLIEKLNELIFEKLPKKQKLPDIKRVVLAGNTVMLHIAAGVDPAPIGRFPFEPPVRKAYEKSAADFGFSFNNAVNANVVVLPCPKGFIGADAVAAIVSSGLTKKQNALLIDIGTNSEIALVHDGEIYVTSCATGPALEGTNIRHGMRAAAGAIESVKIDPETLKAEVKIIGDIRAEGMCGSGIIDAAAEMFSTGIIETSGRFSKINSKYIGQGEDGVEYILSGDITVTQKDIRAVQLAKAALYAGAKMLVNAVRERTGDTFKISEILLAGAFGSKINPENALKIGMFPDVKLSNIQSIGNASGHGACMALFDKNAQKTMEAIAEKCIYVETALDKNYPKIFADSSYFPHKNDAFSANSPYIFPCYPGEVHENSECISVLTPLREYKYQSLDAFNGELLDDDLLQKAMGKIMPGNDIFELPCPFSLICAYIDPTKIYRQSSSLEQLLMQAVTELEETIKLSIKRGISIISMADGEGVSEIAGPKFFSNISGKYTIILLKKIEPLLANTNCAVHLCGKLSFSLHHAGLITVKPMRYDEKMTYKEALRFFAKQKNNKFFGHRCIHYETPAPILYKLDLIK
jgi:uncharacterized 2Fe-2S/4Fe-4S cluster protein (DUF4445 family)